MGGKTLICTILELVMRRLVIGLLCGFALTHVAACSVQGEFPRLVDIPEAPEQATPMEEKRQIADEMIEQAKDEDEDAKSP